MPSFMNFITSKANKEHVKTLPFFIEHNEEIGKMSEVHYWFDITNIKHFYMRVHIPFMSYTQNIEAASKDFSLCKTQSRDKITNSFMTSLHSYFATNARESLQKDEDL